MNSNKPDNFAFLQGRDTAELVLLKRVTDEPGKLKAACGGCSGVSCCIVGKGIFSKDTDQKVVLGGICVSGVYIEVHRSPRSE